MADVENLRAARRRGSGPIAKRPQRPFAEKTAIARSRSTRTTPNRSAVRTSLQLRGSSGTERELFRWRTRSRGNPMGDATASPRKIVVDPLALSIACNNRRLASAGLSLMSRAALVSTRSAACSPRARSRVPCASILARSTSVNILRVSGGQVDRGLQYPGDVSTGYCGGDPRLHCLGH